MEVVDQDTKLKLKTIIAKIERLEEEKRNLLSDIKDVFAEAKSMGFDTKVIKHIVKVRAQNAADVKEYEELVDVYKHALDMI